MLEVRLIGKFDIQCDGKPITISSRSAQSLFAYLILTAGTLHRREKLGGEFWPESSDAKARAYLRHELWRIRKAFAPVTKFDYFVADEMHISFNPTAEHWLDAAMLAQVPESASTDELMEVLSMYQGELLPGFYDEWVLIEREHLQVIYEQKMAHLLELLEKEKRWSEILEWAERWISFGATPEAAFRYLMIAHHALGDRAKIAATYERCVQALRELDLKPSEETRALAFKQTRHLNIPIPLTSFIGREKELKEVASLLAKSRLVTLTGSGGVGKTRLAIQVVADVLERFPDGVWFLDLAPLNDPALVPATLAKLLGLRESGEIPVINLLINYLRSRAALVIFDNCEHLVETCAQLVHSLLTSSGNLSILATSREALRVSGEIPYRVPSLEIPNVNAALEIETLLTMESVKLFVERAMVTSPGFAITPPSVLVIAQICRRLDGIPLAIELAAARVNLLTVEQISNRLDDRFRLLTQGLRSALARHQTLQAMIEWSYDLLSEQERLLFIRLGVFTGGWTLEAAEAVCSGDGIEPMAVLDLLSQLVHKSLVLVETLKGENRYRRLETIRQFARQQLLESNEEVRLRDKHLAYFLKKAEEIEPCLMGAEQSAWMDYIDLELDNIRLALEWSTSTKRGEESLRLFSALGWFWFIRCHVREGQEWFRRALQLKGNVSKSAQAKALRSASFLYYVMDNVAAAISFHQENLELYRELNDEKEISTTLQLLGVAEYGRGNLAQARPFLEESLHISRKVKNKAAMPRVLMHLGFYAEAEGDYVTAWQHYQESLSICRELGEGHLAMVILGTMGRFALAQKQLLQAREYYKESLEIGLKLKDKRTVAEELLSLAEILCVEERYSECARLHGFVEALFDESESLTESHLADIKRTADIPKKHLGAESYRKEFEIGKTLKLEQAVGIALKRPS